MQKALRYLLTAAVILTCLALVLWHYRDYLANPWTRDGRVNANVIQVAPRVSGPVVDLPIVDNQRVKAGDLLFRIDPRTYQTALALAEAELDRTLKSLETLDSQIRAAETGIAQAEAQITQAKSDVAAKQSILEESERELARNASLLDAGDVAQAARSRDFAAIGATLARLGRIADRSLTEVWDAQDLSV